MHWIFFLNLWLKTCKALNIWVCPSFFLSLSASLPSFFSSEVISFDSLGWPRMMDCQHLPCPYIYSDFLVLVSRALGLQARTFPPDPLIPLVVWYPVSSSIKFYISCGSQVLGNTGHVSWSAGALLSASPCISFWAACVPSADAWGSSAQALVFSLCCPALPFCVAERSLACSLPLPSPHWVFRR